MCVIASYLGNRRAAPILLEMLRREEGLNGGYYSGIATVHEGQLYHAKAVGSTDHLIATTEAANLPGTIGIIHSRTPSGGGVEWGHPFVDTREELAYIANGAVGRFKNLPLLAAASERLLAGGHRFRSAQEEPVASYPVLPNGISVHFSDLLCQAIAEAYAPMSAWEEGLLLAGKAAYEALPGELVGLCLHASRGDEIVALRHNKPLLIGRNAEGEQFMASAALAFPDGVHWQMQAPASAATRVRRNGDISVLPFTAPGLIPVGQRPSALRVAVALEEALAAQSPCGMEPLLAAMAALYPADVLTEKEVLLYEALHALEKEGKIALGSQPREPLQGNPVAPATVATLVPPPPLPLT